MYDSYNQGIIVDPPKQCISTPQPRAQDASLFLLLANDQQEAEADERIRFGLCGLAAAQGASFIWAEIKLEQM